MADGQAHGLEQDTKKERGAGFPTISLPEAMSIVKQAGAYGKQHSMSAMAGYAGHKTDNSGPFRQKLASLKDWGFISVSGKTVHLTPSAVGLAHPTSGAAEAEILLKAFRGCVLFWDVYTDLAKGVILDAASIGNKAVAAYDISVRAKEKFAMSFIHSAVAVGLAESTSMGEVRLLPEEQSNVKKSVLKDEYVTEFSKDVKLSEPEPLDVRPAPVTAVLQKPVVSQKWEQSGAAIIFEVHTQTPLAAEAFMEVGRAVKALEELWTVLKPAVSDQDTAGTADDVVSPSESS